MKKFSIIFLTLILSCTVFCLNAANKKEVKEIRNVSRFERILLKGSPTIKYRQGATCKVEVKASKNIIKDVITQVEDNKLVVYIKSSNWMLDFGDGYENVVVYVTSPDLIGVELQGSGNFESLRKLDTDNLNVEIKGSGDVVFKDIICDKINVSLVGSGDLDIEKIISLYSNIELVGSGDIIMNQQKVNQTKVKLKGSGDIKLNLINCGTLACNLLGSGDIILHGDVVKFSNYTRGSGEILTMGLNIKN